MPCHIVHYTNKHNLTIHKLRNFVTGISLDSYDNVTKHPYLFDRQCLFIFKIPFIFIPFEFRHSITIARVVGIPTTLTGTSTRVIGSGTAPHILRFVVPRHPPTPGFPRTEVKASSRTLPTDLLATVLGGIGEGLDLIHAYGVDYGPAVTPRTVPVGPDVYALLGVVMDYCCDVISGWSHTTEYGEWCDGSVQAI